MIRSDAAIKKRKFMDAQQNTDVEENPQSDSEVEAVRYLICRVVFNTIIYI